MSDRTRLRRGPVLELPVRADASGPAGDGGRAARAPVAGPRDGAGARDRLRRGRQPDRDGGRDAGHHARSGVDLAAEPIAEGNAVIEAVGLDNVELRQGDVSDAARRRARRVRLRDRPRRLRVGARAGPRRPARARSTRTSRRTGSRYVSYNANPGGVPAPARCARPGCGSRARRADPDRRAPSGRAGALPLPAREPRRRPSDWWGGLLESQLEPLAQGPGVPARARRPQRRTGRRSGSPDFAERAAGHRPRLRRRVRPRQPAARAGARRRSRTSWTSSPAATGSAASSSSTCCAAIFFRQSVLCRDSRRPADAPGRRRLRGPALRRARRRAGRRQPEGLLGSALALLRSRAPDTLAFAELRAATGRRPRRARRGAARRASWPSS